MRHIVKVLGLVGFVSAVACSATPVVVNNHVQQSQTTTQNTKQQTVAKLDSVVKSTTPPAGATTTTNAPQAVAGRNLPIGGVTVYVFTMNVDVDPDPETLYWAATETGTMVWGKIGLNCVDDGGKATGETGEADFIYERRSDGRYAWFTGTDACAYTTKYGCAGDASGETCGGCDYNADFIACVATTSN